MKYYLFVTALALAFTASNAQSNTATPGMSWMNDYNTNLRH
jgi:hypothetical protein